MRDNRRVSSTEQSGPPRDSADSFAYIAERDQALDHDRCFLCGADLTQTARTDEHVFPKWLLRDFELFNARIHLPTGRTVPYRSLTIPCCTECNTLWLGKIEDEVAPAVRAGPAAVEAMDRTTLGLWMTKIFYGLVFKDLAYAIDPRDPTGDQIANEELLRHFAELHHLLQIARKRVDLAGDQTPASVFVLRTLDSEIAAHGFDYRDLFIPPFLAIRMGHVGLIACLLDWGTVADIKAPILDSIGDLVLHPVQFQEAAALYAHWRTRFNRVPKYVIAAGNGEADQWITLPLGGMSGLPIYDDFDPETYAHMLGLFTGFELDRIWNQESGQLWSSFRSADGAPLQMPSIEAASIEPPRTL
jgi:hypothetical protein